MKLTILGTGSFLSNLNHYGPGYLLEIGDKRILIDAGNGTQIQLLKLGIDIQDIDYIFITHFHADHTGDLISLLVRNKLFLLNNDLKGKDIEVYGPRGISKFVKNLFNIYGHLGVYEKSKVKTTEINNKIDFDNFNVIPFSVEHLGLNAYSYRFESEGETVVFSGDTVQCQGINNAAKNADVFIVDASTPTNKAQSEAHITTKEIAMLCQKSKVKTVILSHLLPAAFEKDLESEIKKYFKGKVIKGKDLMEISNF